MAKLSETVINECKDGYPELWEKREFIFKTLTAEEEQFNKTIDKGLEILAGMEEKLVAAGSKELSGEDTFKLYDTYGFPVDLTAEILEEKGFTYDAAGFEACMEKQRQTARAARKETNYMGADASVYDDIDLAVTSEFVGYDKTTSESTVTVLTTETEIVDTLAEGMIGTIIVPETPFYATMGGQIGDTGVISTANGEFTVKDTIKLKGGKIGHVGEMTSGMIKVGEKVTLTVDAERRARICKNHSATHLMQKALREVLGTHVEQKGSYQDADRTRFDFSHFSAMTSEEIAKVEKMVNDKIAESLPVTTAIMSIDEAKKSGAMALFGEKYGETVRVVKMGDFSVELCGGTHVSNTSEISAFKILSESGVAAGTRRIEAITGQAVFEYYADLEAKLNAAATALKCKPSEVEEKIAHLQKQLKETNSELESLKAKAAQAAVGDVMDSVVEVKGVKLLATSVAGVDMNGLRDLGDDLKNKLGEGVIVLASDCDGKVNLVVMATDAAQAAGAHAGNLIKAIAPKVGGGGGGRPNMAQAGGKNPAGIEDALNEAKSVLEGMLK
jgi:alanyl-tRNA synthetase